MSVICIFGDSTAWGAWDLEKGGWVKRLWLHCAKSNREDDIYNLSISGGTTRTILKRFESEAKIREVDTVIFQTGGNDAAYDKDTKNHLVPLEEFKSNLKKIVRQARGLAKRIVFIGFENCVESKTMPVAWCNLCYANKDIEEYNLAMKLVCMVNKIEFVEIFGLLSDLDFEDGLHPNARGHEKVFEVIKSAILDNYEK